MNNYRRIKRFIGGFALIYTIIGALTWGWWQREIFPIFSWELFSTVPTEVTDYEVKFLKAGDQMFTPPLAFEQAGDLVVDPHSITAYANIQALGQALETGSEPQINAARQHFESLGLKRAVPVTYAVLKQKTAPIARWQTDGLENEEFIAMFQVAKP